MQPLRLQPSRFAKDGWTIADTLVSQALAKLPQGALGALRVRGIVAYVAPNN